MDARHTFTSDAPCFPLHAVEPEEPDYFEHRGDPAQPVWDCISRIWGSSAESWRHQQREAGR